MTLDVRSVGGLAVAFAGALATPPLFGDDLTVVWGLGLAVVLGLGWAALATTVLAGAGLPAGALRATLAVGLAEG
jgi:hypothetical protein